MNESEIKFTGCKFLDFSDNYHAKKELIDIKNETKVCWDRPVIDVSYPALVQFCTKRGRMNNPEMCLCEETKQCSDYINFEHIVNLKTKNHE